MTFFTHCWFHSRNSKNCSHMLTKISQHRWPQHVCCKFPQSIKFEANLVHAIDLNNVNKINSACNRLKQMPFQQTSEINMAVNDNKPFQYMPHLLYIVRNENFIFCKILIGNLVVKFWSGLMSARWDIRIYQCQVTSTAFQINNKKTPNGING